MNSVAKNQSVLLVDDIDDSRLTTKWFLSSLGYAVECARSGEEALRVFDPRIHDIVLTDNSMPGMTGAEMAHIIKMRSPTTLVVMYTGGVPEDQSCLDAVVRKPAHLLAVHDAIGRLTQAPPSLENTASMETPGHPAASPPRIRVQPSPE